MRDVRAETECFPSKLDAQIVIEPADDSVTLEPGKSYQFAVLGGKENPHAALSGPGGDQMGIKVVAQDRDHAVIVSANGDAKPGAKVHLHISDANGQQRRSVEIEIVAGKKDDAAPNPGEKTPPPAGNKPGGGK